jgi:hypothetical protein
MPLVSPILLASWTLLAAPGDGPRELGAVRWRTGFGAALANAKRSTKPLFVLFQEVPG